MKKRILSFLLLICMIFGIAACGDSSDDSSKFVDYAAKITLDEDSETKKMEVTVKNYIDGDTTHFNVPTSFNDQGILKARYLAVNTPESTGKIEEWGKKASNYTKTKLQTATSIILETNGDKWEKDSTGDRYLVWVWYKSASMTEYRCLNIELLQEGLALGSKAGDTRYGETCTKAINQASNLKLHVFSNEKDPDYYYGAAIEIDLKELRTNIDQYTGARVAFEGYISQYSNQGVYVEKYDEETDMYYGVYVYYGFFLSSFGQKILVEGNHVRIVGNVQYWETGDSYQVSDLTYDPFDLTNPNNIQLLDNEYHPVANPETTAERFFGKVDITTEGEDGEPVVTQRNYKDLALNTSICMKNLKVVDMYTTNNGGDNDGAITITCTVDGKTITVRTAKLYEDDDANNPMITEDYFKGKTMDVVGIIEYFDGDYQIEVHELKDITLH